MTRPHDSSEAARGASGLNSCLPRILRWSADVYALLVFRLNSGVRLLRGKRENGCVLPFSKPRQKHGLAIGELKRVMMDVRRALIDLSKDRNAVARVAAKDQPGLIRHRLFEG